MYHACPNDAGSARFGPNVPFFNLAGGTGVSPVPVPPTGETPVPPSGSSFIRSFKREGVCVLVNE